MITELIPNQEKFFTDLEKIYKEVALNDSLSRMRTRAWDQFLEVGLPTRKIEVYNYIRLRSLYAHSYQPSLQVELSNSSWKDQILPECQHSYLVFVNGVFRSDISDMTGLSKKDVAMSIQEAMGTYSSFLNNQWTQTIRKEKDPFALLNIALHRQGVFIYLPPRYVVEAPIQVLHVIEKGDNTLLLPRIQLFMGKESQATIVSTQVVLSGKDYCINQAADFTLEDGARLHYVQSLCNEQPNIWHFEATRAVLKRDSYFDAVYATEGSATVRADYRVTLAGENGEARLNGVNMLAGDKEAHVNVLMEHEQPFCRSMQFFKSALADQSNSSFEGKILVRKEAQKTEAFQLNNNLLLSDRANADSKPNLEIFADDVKASHGSTFGKLDEEQVFYLQARGFSIEEAQSLLIHGFCKEIVDFILVPSLHSSLEQRARRYLEQGKNV